MREVPALAALIDRQADGVGAHAHRRGHLLGRRLRQHLPRRSAHGGLHFDDEPRQVVRGRPQPRRGLLGVDVPRGVHGATLAVVRARQLRGHLGRRRLRKRAARHLQRPEHGGLHELGERLRRELFERELHDGDAAAGVLVALERRAGEQHLAHVGGRLAVEDLHEARTQRRRVVAWEAEAVVGARRVTEERARRHRTSARVVRDGHAPRLQYGVHVGVKVELPVLR